MKFKAGDLISLKSWINRDDIPDEKVKIPSIYQPKFPFPMKEEDHVMVMNISDDGGLNDDKNGLWSFVNVQGSVCVVVRFYKKIDGIELYEVIHPTRGRIACWSVDMIHLQDVG